MNKASLKVTVPTEKIDVGGIAVETGEYISNTIYNMMLRDRKGKKHINIEIPIIFNKGIDNEIISIDAFDKFVMEAFYNLYIENRNHSDNDKDTYETNIVYLNDIYTRVYGNSKPQKAQRNKVKKSIAKLRNTRINIDYSNFIFNEEMKKRYSTNNMYNDLLVQSGVDISLIYCFEQEYIHTKTKEKMTRYVVNGLPLFSIATVKNRYKTIDSKLFYNLRLSNTNISVTEYFIKCMNAKVEVLTISKIFDETNLRKDPNMRYLDTICKCLKNIANISDDMYKRFELLDKNNKVTLVRKDVCKLKIIYK